MKSLAPPLLLAALLLVAKPPALSAIFGLPGGQSTTNNASPSLCSGNCRCGVLGGALRDDVVNVSDGGFGNVSNLPLPREQRFIGGEDVRPNRFPWLVAVLRLPPLTGVTTGALISDRHVLTSASAIEGVPADFLRVTLGAEALCNLPNTNSGVNMSVAAVSAYPGGVRSTATDLAVLRLVSRVPFGPTLRPVCLPPNERSTYSGRVATVVGFGGNATEPLVSTATEAPNATATAADANQFRWRCRPRALFTPVLTPLDCAGSGRGAPGCVGTPDTPQIVCPNDSGSLVQVFGTRREVQLIGLLAGGSSCNATEIAPAAFSRTATNLRWLLRQTADGCFCAAP